MASHVMYDGVPGAGGTIFGGIKFWVSLGVPQRSSIIEKIESNGGVVVPREKDADMLIADHAKKNAPPDSYSWKFITESVSAGIIQVEDKYLIDPPPTERRSILAGPHARKTRTPFTTHDDALIAKHVLREGINTAGNNIYMKLEDEYPHHTWQSWRARWVKVLSFKSPEELNRLARMANANSDNAPRTAKHAIRTHHRDERPQVPQANATSSAGREPSRDRTKPSPRVPRVTTSEAALRPVAVSPVRPNRRSHTQDAVHETSGETVQEGTAQYQDRADLNESAAPEEQETVEDEREGEHGAHDRGQEEAGGELEEEDTQDDASIDGGPSSFSERDQFFSDFRDYCEANGKRLHTRCVIEDHEVDLFDLYQAVSAQSVPPDEVDWKQVAEDVGLGRSRRKEVTAGLLESSYHRYLGDFVEAMMSFEEIEEDPDEDIAEEDGAVSGDKETSTNLTTPRPSQQHRALSSTLGGPSETRSRKRLPDERPLTPEKLPKRRRTVHTEIPMTPEDKLRTTGRLSAPLSAPGNLHRIIDEEQAESEEPSQRTPRQQPPAEESFDMTPSQQLRSETELVVNPEHAETPTLYFSPTAARLGQRNDGRLETIQEEVPSTYTPTRRPPKKRALPASFEQAQPPPPREQRKNQLREELERRRQQHRQQHQQQQDQQRGERRRRDERQAHEQDRGRVPQQQPDNGQEQQSQRLQQVAANPSDPDEENVEENKEAFRRCQKDYLSRGAKRHEIIEAMRRTTMTPGEVMDIVVESLRAGRGVPDNYEGIWTDRDDSQLRYVVRVGGLERMPGDDSNGRRRKEKAQKMLDRLLHKHGEARVELRKKFLREVALAQQEMERRMQA
ncbi:TRF2-interacting telomeric protein/Rap1 C terminal domain-containing protein [Trichoderma gracile]